MARTTVFLCASLLALAVFVSHVEANKVISVSKGKDGVKITKTEEESSKPKTKLVCEKTCKEECKPVCKDECKTVKSCKMVPVKVKECKDVKKMEKKCKNPCAKEDNVKVTYYVTKGKGRKLSGKGKTVIHADPCKEVCKDEEVVKEECKTVEKEEEECKDKESCKEVCKDVCKDSCSKKCKEVEVKEDPPKTTVTHFVTKTKGL